MPARGHSSAPKFDNQGVSLRGFLEDVKSLCVLHGITKEEDQVVITYNYLTQTQKDEWKGVIDSAPKTWDKLKEMLQERLYPDAAEARVYSRAALEACVAKYTGEIETVEKFGQYCREFARIAEYLKKRSTAKLTEDEENRLFIRVFRGTLGSTLRNRLSVQNASHDPEVPWDKQKVIKLAGQLLTGVLGDWKEDQYSMADSGFTPAPVKTEIKTEPSDMSVFYREQLARIEEERRQDRLEHARQIETLANSMRSTSMSQSAMSRPVGNTGRGQNNRASVMLQEEGPVDAFYNKTSQLDWSKVSGGNSSHTHGSFSQDCNFCSSPDHYMNRCPKAREAVERGELQWLDNNGRQNLVLGNGRWIPKFEDGLSMGERAKRALEKLFNTVLPDSWCSSPASQPRGEWKREIAQDQGFQRR